MADKKYYAFTLASMAEAVPQLLEDCHADNWQSQVAVVEAIAEQVADYARGLADQDEHQAGEAALEELKRLQAAAV